MKISAPKPISLTYKPSGNPVRLSPSAMKPPAPMVKSAPMRNKPRKLDGGGPINSGYPVATPRTHSTTSGGVTFHKDG